MPLSAPKERCVACEPCCPALPVAADAVIYDGAILMVNAGGFVLPADDATGAGLSIAGIAFCNVDNTGGADGDQRIVVQHGHYERFGANAGAGTPLTAANIGQIVYAIDDEFVGGAADAPNTLRVGILRSIEPDGGLMVEISPVGAGAP